jgi:Flp pilus assembly protein TadD
VAQDLANALDQWTFIRRGPYLRHAPSRNFDSAERLVGIAKVTDPDAWRNQLRDTLAETAADRGQTVEALRRLAATADPEHLPEASVTRLAWALKAQGSHELAIDLLRRTQRVHPNNFWVNADLGDSLAAAGHPEEAVRFYSVALALRPRSEVALHRLGEALHAAGRDEEAAMYLKPSKSPPRPPGGPR